MERLVRYSDAELHLLHDFLADGYDLQVEQAARIRDTSPAEVSINGDSTELR
jgi:hypothetical protein